MAKKPAKPHWTQKKAQEDWLAGKRLLPPKRPPKPPTPPKGDK